MELLFCLIPQLEFIAGNMGRKSEATETQLDPSKPISGFAGE